MQLDDKLMRKLIQNAWEKACKEQAELDAIIKEIKESGAKDTPVPVTWEPEFTDDGYCPICGACFDFPTVNLGDRRCPKCNQLFAIKLWIT